MGLILRIIPLKLFLDHSRLQRSRKGQERVDHVTRILLAWTTKATLFDSDSFTIFKENHTNLAITYSP